MRKKIVVCSIELIQNNLKHNPEYTAKLSITENINEYVISIKETINKSKLENLKNKINEINKTEIDQLNQIYNQNLENNQINTGNGLVLCKLKSTKNIYIYYSETSNNLVESRIDITFEKL
ncbi:MAG: hypothetical protein C0596_14890 [Marinilabiliales bacterium]|nr:MAG: hypothetical protein C0596_14890 [Marinilabiliales bacterium]